MEDLTPIADDEMLDTLTIIATPDTVAKEIGTRYGGLVDRITVSWWRKPWGPAVNDVLRTL